MKPNLKVIRRWVRALRSGKFKQGKGALRIIKNGAVTWCCLGVLCELHRRSSKQRSQWSGPDADRETTYLGNFAHLPEEVQQWAGLNRNNPILRVCGSDNPILRVCGSASCAACNDHRCLPFSKIADAIERTFLPKKKKT